MSKDGVPPAEFEVFYAPHITDPDRPQEMMSEAEMKRAARNVFKTNPDLLRKRRRSVASWPCAWLACARNRGHHVNAAPARPNSALDAEADGLDPGPIDGAINGGTKAAADRT